MLDSYAGLPASFSTGFTDAVSVFSETFRDWIPIDCVSIGDRVLMIKDNDGWLEYSSVLGKTVVEGEYDDDAQMGPATWLHSAEGWKHPAVNYLKEGLLYNLITKSGYFMVKTPAGQICVRDALEVGISRIEETYSFTANELRKTESRPPNR